MVQAFKNNISLKKVLTYLKVKLNITNNTRMDYSKKYSKIMTDCRNKIN